MSEQYPADAHYQGQNYRRFFQRKIDVILDAFNQNNRRGMRAVYNDVNELALLEAKEIAGLNKLLKGKFGRSLIDVTKGIERMINKIMKRKRINNDEEFYLVKWYIDEMINSGKNGEASKLDSILYAYECRK
jgi:hypothetical protein